MDEKCTGNDGVRRVHPRFAAELFLDALEFYPEPRTLATFLRKRGFCPDLLRAKGYLNPPYIVGILPFSSPDLSEIAAISVRKNIEDSEDREFPASATIVRMANAVTPLEFTILTVADKEVDARRPVSFDDLRQAGVREILRKLYPDLQDRFLERLSRGRGLAPIALGDFASDELKLGFISDGEYAQTLANVDLYSDIARLHAYLARAAAPSAGCSYCTSTSCYACTSCSCGLLSSFTATAVP